ADPHSDDAVGHVGPDPQPERRASRRRDAGRRRPAQAPVGWPRTLCSHSPRRSAEEEPLSPNKKNKDTPDGTSPPASGDGNATTRLAPRPISRPSVDPASRQAFGRPAGFDGSFLDADKHRDQGEFTPRNAPPDPVLAEAFGRPSAEAESLQRHPADAGALEAERDVGAEMAAAASLSSPALPKPQPARASGVTGKLGVRDVLFGGKVSYRALAVLLLIVVAVAFIGGWVGRKTAEVVEAFTTSKVTLSTNTSSPPEGRFAKVAAAVADSVVTIQAMSD